jgi:hypothetical protein
MYSITDIFLNTIYLFLATEKLPNISVTQIGLRLVGSQCGSELASNNTDGDSDSVPKAQGIASESIVTVFGDNNR